MLRMSRSAARRAAGSPRMARPRTAIAFVAGLALMTTGTLATVATVAHATPQSDLQSEQQKAAELESEIQANGNRVSVLDEQYLEAQAAIQQATDQYNADRVQVAAKQRATDRIRGLVSARAAELYMSAGNPAPLAAFDVSNTQELGSQSEYGAAAADQDRQLIDNAKVAIESLGLQQQALAKARAKAEDESKQLDAARTEITAATAQQTALLAQVKGKIATLVNQIQVQQQQAQEAAARAQMEREAAAQAAAQQQQQQTSSNGGSPDGGSTSSPPPTGLPAPSAHAAIAVQTAEAQIGKPYVYAGSGPDVFDCSGLTMYAWAAAGVSLPHNALAQYDSLPHVPMDALQPGDLVFYGSPIHHVGLFVGNGTMVEAPYTGVDVRYHSIYRPDFAGAARP